MTEHAYAVLRDVRTQEIEVLERMREELMPAIEKGRKAEAELQTQQRRVDELEQALDILGPKDVQAIVNVYTPSDPRAAAEQAIRGLRGE